MAPVAVVIAARDAERTIERTLRSLQAQTHHGWRAVVVDDCSMDGTAEVVRRIALADGRIRLVQGGGRGPGAARNVGLAGVTEAFVLFLDSDDLIAPDHLRRMTKAALDADADLAHCGWRLEDGAGNELSRHPALAEGTAMFERHVEGCPLVIHAILARTEVVRLVGGFDEDLNEGCEDWDLWQRIARTGARFVRVPHVLATYVGRPESLSRDALRLLPAAVKTVERGHRSDDRVPSGIDRYPHGRDAERLPEALLGVVVWLGTIEAAIGRDVDLVLDAAPHIVVSWPDPAAIAATLAQNATFARMEPLDSVLLDRRREFERLLRRLGEYTKFPALGGLVAKQLLERVARNADSRQDLHLLHVAAKSVDLNSPLTEVFMPSGCDMLVLNVSRGSRHLGVAQLSVPDGRLSPDLMATAIAGQLWERITLERLRTGAGWFTASRTLAARPRILGRVVAILVSQMSAALVGRRLGPVRTLIREPLRAICFELLPHKGRGVVPRIGRARGRTNGWELVESHLSRPVRVPTMPTTTPSSAAPARKDSEKVRRHELLRESHASGRRRCRAVVGRNVALMFHMVAPAGPECLRRWRLSPDEFRAAIECIITSGSEVLALDAWVESLDDTRDGPPRVLLTFDDGYRDFAEHALPVLADRHLPSTLFVVPGAVGGESVWDRRLGATAPLMSWEALRTLGSDVSIGSHSTDHPFMAALSSGEARLQLSESRAIIKAELGTEPWALAYPYGNADGAVAQIAESVGFKAGFTCEERFAERHDARLLLPRVEVTADLDLERLLARTRL